MKMMSGPNTSTVCPHCQGRRFVVTKDTDAAGKPVEKPCPVCRGSGTSGGLMTK